MIIASDILKFIILVVITFFSCQIITDGKKRISYIGVLLICFSSAIIEYINSGLIEALIFSQLIFISLNNILKKYKYKYFYVVLIAIRNFRLYIVI